MSCAEKHEELAELIDQLPESWSVAYMKDWKESDSFSQVELKSGYDLDKAAKRINLDREAIGLFIGTSRDSWDTHLDEDENNFISERNLYLTHDFDNAAGYARIATEQEFGEPDITEAVVLEVEVPIDNIEVVDHENNISNKDEDRDIEYGHFKYGVIGVDGAVGSAYPLDWVNNAYRPDGFWDAKLENSREIEI